MNNVFSFQRFIWLFNKHTKEHYKTYLMSLTVLSGILALVLGYIALRGALDVKTQHAVFGVLLVGTGFIFTSSIFSDLGNKGKSISTLTLPVAHLERFMVAWVYSFIIFQIVFIACFCVINNIFVGLNGFKTEAYKAASPLWGRESIYLFALLYYCFYHALAFLGAVLFKKAHFVKMAFTFLVFFVVLMLVNKIVAGLIFDPQVSSSSIPFSDITIIELGNHRYNLDANEWLAPVLTIITLVSTVSLWAATYFKLKEKQV